MFINGQNMGFSLWAKVEKTIYGMETHWLSKKIPGAVVTKNGPITIDLLEKRYSGKQCFLLPTPLATFSWFIEWSSDYRFS